MIELHVKRLPSTRELQRKAQMTSDDRHISVCICTFRRPDFLRRLLNELEQQKTEGLFSYSIVVVDNDAYSSARQVVQLFQHVSSLDVTYCVEPEQNIALARNRAVENARGNFIAFIDDDEFPDNKWLLNLYAACVGFESDGVFGPVKPHFKEGCPEWIVKGGLCERKSHLTGTIMEAGNTRTGNVLLKREIFDDPGNRFDPLFGRTGGSDVWFFMKVMGQGRTFVWCDEAIVYETILPERWKASFYIKRSLRKGGLNGEGVRKKAFAGRSLVLVSAVCFVYAMIMPIALFLGKHIFMKYLVKFAYHFAWLSGYFGHVFVRFRDD